MEERENSYHYTESGLNNIWLKNGFSIENIEGFGECLSIDDLEGLHQAIGMAICKNKFITGDEFRFLRKELDLSQTKLGELMGVSDQSIANWEKNSSIPKPVITLLKALYFQKLNKQFKIEYLIQRAEHKPESANMEFVEENGLWNKKTA